MQMLEFILLSHDGRGRLRLELALSCEGVVGQELFVALPLLNPTIDALDLQLPVFYFYFAQVLYRQSFNLLILRVLAQLENGKQNALLDHLMSDLLLL